jgi:hypothetical protein
MRTKALLTALLLLVAALAGYWYFSPYLAMHQLQTAAQNNDADAFNERVDYPRLRESLKGQLSAKMATELANVPQDNPFAALGLAVGSAIVNQMVDAFVRPEMMMRVINDGEFELQKPEMFSKGGTTSTEKMDWDVERKGLDKVILRGRESAASKKDDGQVDLVFERSGFANWRLTEVRSPVTQ